MTAYLSIWTKRRKDEPVDGIVIVYSGALHVWTFSKPTVRFSAY
jgi:hypothetical protein